MLDAFFLHASARGQQRHRMGPRDGCPVVSLQCQKHEKKKKNIRDASLSYRGMSRVKEMQETSLGNTRLCSALLCGGWDGEEKTPVSSRTGGACLSLALLAQTLRFPVTLAGCFFLFYLFWPGGFFLLLKTTTLVCFWFQLTFSFISVLESSLWKKRRAKPQRHARAEEPASCCRLTNQSFALRTSGRSTQVFIHHYTCIFLCEGKWMNE